MSKYKVKKCDVYVEQDNANSKPKPNVDDLWAKEWESEFSFIKDPVHYMTHKLSKF